ncbi:MAG: MBL fold metallo-hydrolase [Polyangiaceae bacterium]|nr:MBL fold metallo-hydrolase [Polyangiaceae bacterium]
MTNEQLAPPNSDRLIIYVLGSGYGESQVVLFPGSNRRCMVVDSCRKTRRGKNLTASLLRKLDIKKIDLLVLTHSDEDHIGGAPELIDEFDPELLWHSDFVGSMRGLVAKWLRAKPGNRRYLELQRTVERIDRLAECNRTDLVHWKTLPWEHQPSGCIVQAVAPPHSISAIRAFEVDNLVRRNESGEWIVPEEGQKLLNGPKSPGDHPNSFSIALSIQWLSHRILLCGDVEKPQWERVITKLSRGDGRRLPLLRELDVVKIAHHGSDNAFCEEAWQLHLDNKRDGEVFVPVTPFNQKAKLPDSPTLEKLRQRYVQLAITADVGGAFDRAKSCQWELTVPPAPQCIDGQCMVVVTLHCDGSRTMQATRDAGIFACPSRPSMLNQLLSTADDFPE